MQASICNIDAVHCDAFLQRTRNKRVKCGLKHMEFSLNHDGPSSPHCCSGKIVLSYLFAYLKLVGKRASSKVVSAPVKTISGSANIPTPAGQWALLGRLAKWLSQNGASGSVGQLYPRSQSPRRAINTGLKARHLNNFRFSETCDT